MATKRKAPTRKKRSETRKASKANRRLWFYICLNSDCRQQFSPTSGTLFADSHLPLLTWFHAIGLMLNAKKGISAKQLQRDLGIGGYKTAWYLNHRIREAMGIGDIPKLGGTVEIDETYIGKRENPKPNPWQFSNERGWYRDARDQISGDQREPRGRNI